MKKLFLMLFLAGVCQMATAQKFGYIDTDFILGKMPEAKKAQSDLEASSGKWEQEIQTRALEIDKMEQDYRAEEVLLTDAMRQERRQSIETKKKEAMDYNKKVFGPEGLLYLRKKELMGPIRDKIYEATMKVVRERKLDFIFDKASDFVMIYADPRHDYSDYVLDILGLGEKDDAVKKK